MAKDLATASPLAKLLKPLEKRLAMPNRACRSRLGPVRRIVCAAAMLLCAHAAIARGDVIYRQGTPSPLIGKVVESDSEELVLQYEKPIQGATQVTIPRDRILVHVVTVSEERLNALEVGKWDGYRDYAEELAAHRIDPAAHRLALRLYLMVAYQSSGSRRRGALQALIRLARTPAEEKRLRVLSFEADPRHDPGLLKAPQEVAPVELFDPEVQLMLMDCFRLARQGYGEQAVDLARKPEVKQGFQAISHLMSFRDFQATAYDTSNSESRLKRLLQIEMALMGSQSRVEMGDSPDLFAPGWSQLISQGANAPFSKVNWLNVMEFDPQQSSYNNGSWE